MRRNIIDFVIIIAMVFMLTACGNNDSKVNEVIQNQIQDNDKNDNQNNQQDENNENVSSQTIVGNIEYNQIDVDLTTLSSTMVYSEVYDMLYTPDNYIGKVVKMKGAFVPFTNQDNTQYYPAVIIADATACCSQGLEFLLQGNPSYPNGYPKTDTIITVVGTFETYDEDGYFYCRLQNAIIV